MSPRRLVHVAAITVAPGSGMGRVAWHWRQEFQRRGYEFLHLGREEVGPVRRDALFPFRARRRYDELARPGDILLVHEPVAGAFLKRGLSPVVYSQGSERRGWELELRQRDGAIHEITWKRRLTFPLWRLRQCDAGFRRAPLVLLSNQQDAAFARERFGGDPSRFLVFRNGVNPTRLDETIEPPEFCVLFLASWIPRKGTATLIDAAQRLANDGRRPRWLLAATEVGDQAVLADWPAALRPSVTVIPRYAPEHEEVVLARASVMVLPSLYEGQPLALLQSMAAGRCVIASACCGQLDLIEDGRTGLLHPPGDGAALARAIASCMDDAGLRRRLGEAARRAMDGRTWRQVSAEVADAVESHAR